MNKIGRNSPCPCGSGKKYKRCCALAKNSLHGIKYDDILSVIFDEENKQEIVIGKTILENQLKRDGPNIANSFDNFYDQHIKEISEEFSRVMELLIFEINNNARKSCEIHGTCLILLHNICLTISAALDCLRHGYFLQPGILIRHAIESICMALHLFLKPEELGLYKSGKLSSTKTINSAKKIIPIIGNIYGFFSNHFAHLGILHKHLTPIKIYKDDKDKAAIGNILFIRFAVNLLYIATELIFIENITSYRYWKKINSTTYAYSPSEAERAWQQKFLGTRLDTKSDILKDSG